jgi:hypothetical protein
MLATPQLTYPQIVVVAGRNLSVNAKPALHRSLPRFVAQMARSLLLSLSLVQSNALAANQGACTLLPSLQLLSASPST